MAAAGIGSSVEGIHAVTAAVAGGRVTTLHVQASRVDDPGVAELIAAVSAAGGEVRVSDSLESVATTDAHQGVVAQARPLPTARPSQFVQSERTPAVLVLDHLEDPRNVGAAARSALAAGFTAMVVAERRASPLSATAFKAAAGALEVLPVAVVSSIPKALQELKRGGLWIVGLDAGGERSIFGLDLLTEPLALVIGSEGGGLGRLTTDVADVVASIPMVGETESLNASTAAAVACFEVARSRGWVT
ncbi:MAG: 23S rRNA (guanosine(2251)-2'-O)-methyltransferase RlmB [Acidimicrobiia bacterium]|nr:23S rRNA (guanosine(2251)-2'-O)-methyltransferase RlmB [Acidimicrobiia bacterium]